MHMVNWKNGWHSGRVQKSGSTGAMTIKSSESQAYELFRRGWSPFEIGVILCLSPLTIYRLLNHNKDKRTRLTTRIDGKLVVLTDLRKRDYPYRCELCDRPLVGRLSYHHWIDCMPHIGLWLCHSCHVIAKAIDENPEVLSIINKYIVAKVKITKECVAVDAEYAWRHKE